MSREGGLKTEYALSNRSSCKGCGDTIDKDEIRIGKESKSNFHDGFDISWFHADCVEFNKIKDINGHELLRWKDQLKLAKKTGEKLDNKEAKKHNDAVWEVLDKLCFVKNDIIELQKKNGMIVSTKPNLPLWNWRVADGFVYGQIGNCPDCETQGLLYNGYEYICKGWVSSYTKCNFKGNHDSIKRYKWNVPEKLNKHKFFKSFESPKDHPTEVYVAVKKKKKEDSEESEEDGKEDKKEGKEIKKTSSKVEVGKEDKENNANDEILVEDEIPQGLELYGMTFDILGSKKTLGQTQKEIKETIENHGGQISTIKSGTSVTVLISSEDDVGGSAKKLEQAKSEKVSILGMDWLEKLTERDGDGIELRKFEKYQKYLLNPVDEQSDLKRIYSTPYQTKPSKKRKGEEAENEGEEGSSKRKKKNQKRDLKPISGSDILKVDKDCELAKTGEILLTHDEEFGWTPYNIMLNMTDVEKGTNKYYRMQVIKDQGEYYFWINWGRIGKDTVGDTRLYEKDSKDDAIDAFIEKFEKFTNNKWEKRNMFKKKPGKYFMVQLDDGHDDEGNETIISIKTTTSLSSIDPNSLNKMDESSKKKFTSTLDPRVQKLVETIFDEKMMMATLKSFEIDLKEMPLGKIKKSQITKGYKILSKLGDLLSNNEGTAGKLKDLTNQFYTLIPHDFGNLIPPTIDNLDVVKTKMSLIDTLVDVEIAKGLMGDDGNSVEHPFDTHYKKLNANISPLDRESEMFKYIEKYVYQGNDKDEFSLEFKIKDIFEIDRSGEEGRFDTWKDTENRQLLWHGSRLTNWVGIISQGLRIAPPEAPKTGYRFGKGIYLASTISKSGVYCFTTPESPTAVMLLCEAALGKMNEVKKDVYMEKPKNGTNSTRALGMTAPDPKQNVIAMNNVTIPLGKPISSGLKTACTHDEFIVYDVAQVRMRYLIMVDIKDTETDD